MDDVLIRINGLLIVRRGYVVFKKNCVVFVCGGDGCYGNDICIGVGLFCNLFS